MRLKLLLCAGAIIVGAAAATTSAAQQFDASDAGKVTIRAVQHLALNPVLVRAVREQNAIELDAATLSERDRQWRDSGSAGLKWALQETPAGQLLRRIVAETGIIKRAYVTDRRGANVAAYPPTDDYFHGDESKWRGSFEDGQIHVLAADEDIGSDSASVQVSAPLIHRGKTIGVLIVAVDAADFDDVETP